MSKTTISVYMQKSLQRLMSPEAKRVGLNAWYRYMYKFIPFGSGLLADDISIDENGIHFYSPQARYLYYGILMVSPTTGSSWAKAGETKVKTSTALQYSAEQHPNACAEWGKVAMDLYGDAIMNELKQYLLNRSENT